MATLTEVLRDIGEEMVEININGQEIRCTRTEAAARRLFLLATGGYMQTKDEYGDTVTTYFKPTASACKAIRDYTEGKPAQEAPKEGKRNAKAGQFDGSIAGRLNKLVNNGTATTKTQS